MTKQVPHPRTANINKKQKIQAKLARHHALCWLAEHFPHAFDNRVQIRPLKTGIMHDILMHAEQAEDAGISKSKLREAVVLFTRRIDYLACLKAQEMRIDLYGNPTSVVSLEEAELAALKIKKRIEKSIKNARKSASPTAHAPKKIQTAVSKSSTANTLLTKPLPPHHYPEPVILARSAQEQSSTARTTTSITIKPSRTYDPEAVARLKEKLGLSKKIEEEMK